MFLGRLFPRPAHPSLLRQFVWQLFVGVADDGIFPVFRPSQRIVFVFYRTFGRRCDSRRDLLSVLKNFFEIASGFTLVTISVRNQVWTANPLRLGLNPFLIRATF